MMPRLGARFSLEVEYVSQTREYYQSEAYRASNQPPAPAVIVADETVIQGPAISQERAEEVIRHHLK